MQVAAEAAWAAAAMHPDIMEALAALEVVARAVTTVVAIPVAELQMLPELLISVVVAVVVAVHSQHFWVPMVGPVL
jgi:hypothetical protein